MSEDRRVDAPPPQTGWAQGVPANWIAGLERITAYTDTERVTHVSGLCPRCDHPLWMDVGGNEIGVGLTSRERIEILLRCNCAEPHEGRPETEVAGCGAFGKVVINR